MIGGDCMTNKELSRLCFLSTEISNLESRLEQLRVAAANCTSKLSGSPRASGAGNKIEKFAIKIAEQEQILAARQAEYDKLSQYIQSIEDSRMRQIMIYRHIDGLTWPQVASKIGGGNTANGVRMSHERFLQKS